MQVAYAEKMEKVESPRRKRRRLHLQELVTECGSATDLAIGSGTPKSHISAMLSKKRGMGDDLADKLERIYGKPEGWFDSSVDGKQVGMVGKLSDFLRSICESFEKLPDDLELRHKVSGECLEIIRKARDGPKSNEGMPEPLHGPRKTA